MNPRRIIMMLISIFIGFGIPGSLIMLGLVNLRKTDLLSWSITSAVSLAAVYLAWVVLGGSFSDS